MKHPHFKYHKGQWFKFRNRVACRNWMAKYGHSAYDHTANPKPAPWQRRVTQEQVR